MTLSARDFPPETPLRHFFEWHERRRRRDRRYERARDPDAAPPSLRAALAAAVGNPDVAAHAAVFAAFEALQPQPKPPRHILVIRLSAFGDFVQALGPIAAIRRHHADDRVTLLTTAALAGFAQALGLFDAVIVDDRPGPGAVRRWLALRRRLRQGGFDRVYDLQTSQRSGLYAWLLRPGMPEWSGIARGCSHPHANLGRDARHTLDKQAEQLLMAGIHPTPLPCLPRLGASLPEPLVGQHFVLLAPGSSPRHPAKRWPPSRFGALAAALHRLGQTPVIVGAAAEAPLAAAIVTACPAALDLTGQTDLVRLGALTQRAQLTVGNDTGVCHLAAAAGCPVIVLFSRASDPARHAPRGLLVRILAEPDLADLAADTVIAEATTILAGAHPQPHRGRGTNAGLR